MKTFVTVLFWVAVLILSTAWFGALEIFRWIKLGDNYEGPLND